MCGIAGYSGKFESSLLDRMNAAQHHRGPDGSGVAVFDDGQVGLAHTRLSIIDLSKAGAQPMKSADSRFSISYNGEIYNFKDLRQELKAAGVCFSSHSDTEVILALYSREGASCLSKLNGMFALAIYDRQTRNLLLARDRYGVKPLYYSKTSLGIVFASELKTLLQEPSVSREINPAAVDYHLAYIWCPAPVTILSNVRKVLPGEVIVVRDGDLISAGPYEDEDRRVPDDSLTIDEAAEELRQMLGSAVLRQLVADAPVGAFLSGGLDSSSIVAFARKEIALPCYTISSRETDRGFVADLPYAEAVASTLNVPLSVIETSEDWYLDLPQLVSKFDEPIADPAALNVFAIARAAKADGIKVLLSGAGGDDLFSGYRRHVAAQAEPIWQALPKTVRSLISRTSRMVGGSSGSGRRLRKLLSNIDLDAADRLAAQFLWQQKDRVERLTGSGTDILAPLREAIDDTPSTAPHLEKMLHLERTYFLADHNLNYTDKASMAASVEVRVPFLDPDLIALAARMPPSMKVRGGTPKWIFKKSMEGLLPNDVIWRPKAGFGVPLATWLRGPLRPWLNDTLASSAATGRFDRRECAVMLEELHRGLDESAYPLFTVACLASWEAELQ